MIFNPLEQFSIIPLFNILNIGDQKLLITLIFSNTSLFLFLIFSIFYIFINTIKFQNRATLKPNKLQYLIESLYISTLTIITDTIGVQARKYAPFIFMIYFSLLSLNLTGMVPYSFTVTSHLIVTFWLALGSFVGINIIGIRKHGSNFFKLFLPAGVSLYLAPLLVVIELVSYFIRVISLSVRLFANMMSGHILLKVILGFAWTLMISGFLGYWLHFIPLGVVFLLIGLELAVSVIQAYVFTVLLCIYLTDAENLH